MPLCSEVGIFLYSENNFVYNKWICNEAGSIFQNKYTVLETYCYLIKTQYNYMLSFKIFMAVGIRIVVFWVLTPCILEGGYHCFG
jgi:hypothetical protein